MSVGTRIFIAAWKSKLDRDLILAGEIGVQDLGIWDFESWTVLDVESEF